MWLGEENAGVWVAREAGGEKTFMRCERSHANTFGDIAWRCSESLAECRGIERSDREYANAALMTTGSARKVRAGAVGRGGKRSIDDGEELVHGVALVYRAGYRVRTRRFAQRRTDFP